MPNGFALLEHRPVVLRVRPVQPVSLRPPPKGHEPARRLVIATFAGGSRQPQQRKLDFRMPGRFTPMPVQPERRDQVGAAPRHPQQGGLARGVPVGHARLDQMPHVVELVAVLQVRPTLWTGHLRQLLRHHEASNRVEISIRLLRGRDLRDELVEESVQFRIRMQRERIGRPLNDFVNVRVIKADPRERPRLKTARACKIRDAARFLALTKAIRNGGHTVRLDPRTPVSVGPDIGKQHRLKLGGGRAGRSNQRHTPQAHAVVLQVHGADLRVPRTAAQ